MGVILVWLFVYGGFGGNFLSLILYYVIVYGVDFIKVDFNDIYDDWLLGFLLKVN